MKLSIDLQIVNFGTLTVEGSVTLNTGMAGLTVLLKPLGSGPDSFVAEDLGGGDYRIHSTEPGDTRQVFFVTVQKNFVQ